MNKLLTVNTYHNILSLFWLSNTKFNGLSVQKTEYQLVSSGQKRSTLHAPTEEIPAGKRGGGGNISDNIVGV